MDKGVQFILECCRTLFNYAAKRRHLSPYAENPFRALELDRIPVENVRAIHLFDVNQERAFLEACDDWQFPLFLTLFLTGMRPGELCHLLLPDDLQLEAGLLHIRNKPKLGWQVKTRNERDLPIVSELVGVLRAHVGQRQYGPVFRRRRFCNVDDGLGTLRGMRNWEVALERCIGEREWKMGQKLSRQEKQRMARRMWRGQGYV